MSKRSSVCLALTSYGLTMKDFAEWLDMTEEGLSRAIKREEEQGFSKKWICLINGYLLESRGFKINHEIWK